VLVWLSVWSEVQIVCIWDHLMPLHPTNPVISCLIQIQTGFTFLVPAYPVCHLNGCTSSSSSSSSYFQVILTLQLIHSYRVCQNLWLLTSSKHVNEFAWLWQTSALVCELVVAPFWTKVASGLLFTPPFSTTWNISQGVRGFVDKSGRSITKSSRRPSQVLST